MSKAARAMDGKAWAREMVTENTKVSDAEQTVADSDAPKHIRNIRPTDAAKLISMTSERQKKQREPQKTEKATVRI